MADAYERDAMPGVGEVLFRHKITSPRGLVAFATFFPSTVLAVLGTGLALAGQVVPGVAVIGGGVGFAALMTFVMVTFAAARIVVSEGEIHVQIGMSGPRIPIDEVASVKVAPSGRNKVGMGASIDLRGNRYIRMWGDNATAVHLELTNGKSIVMTMKEPAAMAAAIEEAIRRRDRAAPKLRAEVASENAEVELERAPEIRRERTAE